MIFTFIIAVIVAIIDQVSKQIVMHNIPLGSYVKVIDKFFYLTYVQNDGVAFSFDFSNIRIINLIIQSIISIAALVGFIYLAIKFTKKNEKVWWLRIAIGLLIGGDLGNIIDRTFYPDHMVTDFLSFTLYYPWIKEGKFQFLSFDFAIFNIADSAIVVGVIMLAIYLIFLNKNFFKGNKEEASEDEVVEVKID